MSRSVTCPWKRVWVDRCASPYYSLQKSWADPISNIRIRQRGRYPVCTCWAKIISSVAQITTGRWFAYLLINRVSALTHKTLDPELLVIIRSILLPNCVWGPPQGGGHAAGNTLSLLSAQSLFPQGQLCLYLLYVLCFFVHFLLDKGAKWISWGWVGYMSELLIQTKNGFLLPPGWDRSRVQSICLQWPSMVRQIFLPILEPRVQRGDWGREVKSAINVDSFAPGPSLTT